MIGILALVGAPLAYGAVRLRGGYPLRYVAVVVAAWLGAVAMVVAVLLLQALLADEGDLPPDDLRGRLPAGLEVVGQSQQCGSGGCWREYTVRDGAGGAADAVAGRLRDAGLEGCRHGVWIPDLRRRCTDVSVRGGTVVVSVNVQWP